VTEVGRIIGGKYRLRKEIGVGAMGSVWSAVHETLGRSAAVKFLTASADDDPETASARFVAEARMAAAVKHRFVVDIFDFGITEDGVSYMVLELLDGEELGELMGSGPPLKVKDAVQLVARCLQGLEEVHKAGIIHRDLKPENIFLMHDSDGLFPKLLDFGISKMADGSAPKGSSMRPRGKRGRQLTAPGMVLGTPWYMAPEQLRGRSDLDERIDIYAMGVILFELLTGRVPFEQENSADLLLAIITEGPADLMLHRPDLGEALADILAMSMATKPEDRYQNARQMRRALEQVADTLPQAWTVVQSGGDEDTVRTGKEAAVDISEVPPAPPRPTRGNTPVDMPAAPRHGIHRGVWAGIGGAAVAVTLLAMGLSAGGNAEQPVRVVTPEPAAKVEIAAPMEPTPAAAAEIAEVAQPLAGDEVADEALAAEPTTAVAAGSPTTKTPAKAPAAPYASAAPKPAAVSKAARPAKKTRKRKKFRSLDF